MMNLKKPKRSESVKIDILCSFPLLNDLQIEHGIYTTEYTLFLLIKLLSGYSFFMFPGLQLGVDPLTV